MPSAPKTCWYSSQQQIVESYVRRQTLKSEAEKKSREIGVKIKEEASS